jgi:hypothetical protein
MELIRPCYLFCLDFDFNSRTLSWCATQNRSLVLDFLQNSSWLSLENAIVLFTISLVLLVGPNWLNYFSIPDSFITENGQTNLTCVLLMISGEILDSFHDGNLIMGGILIKGAIKPVKIGLLSISVFENLQGLGNILLHATEKIWLSYWGGHFTIIFKIDEMFYEMDPLLHSAQFTKVGEEYAFWDQLQLGIQE